MRARGHRHRWATLAITAAVAGLVWAALFGADLRWPAGLVWVRPLLHFPQVQLTKWEFTACDKLLFGMRGSLPTPRNVVIVAIDGQSTKAEHLGTWPFSRGIHAELIRRLNALGARVIAFDVVIDAERANDAEGDQDLVDTCRKAGNVIMASQIAADALKMGENTAGAEGVGLTTMQVPFPALMDACPIGLANFGTSLDSMVRRGEVFYRGDQVERLLGYRVPTLGVAAAARALGVSTESLVQSSELRVGKTRIPLDPDGGFWINFAGERGRIRNLQYMQIIPENWGPPVGLESVIRDAVVFVGATDRMLHDDIPTPYEAKFPGVEVHATVASMLLNNLPVLRWPQWSAVLLAALFALCVSGVSVGRHPVVGLATLAGLALVYCVAAAAAFSVGSVWVPVVAPLMGAGTAYVGGLLYKYLVEEREKRRISALFSKYVSKDVARELMDQEDAAVLGKSRKLPVTCLFSDIRGFTSLSEKMTAEEVVALLNEYFNKMVGVVFEHRGTLDKYVGDAIMATFGVPKSYGNDAERACVVALRMLEVLRALQEKWAAEGRAGLDIGIGVNTGDAVVGNIGHVERLEFTCIGDTINTASRLEGLNKEMGTRALISQSTWEAVQSLDLFEVRKLPPATVKGKAEPVQVYELVGWKAATRPGEAAAAAR